MESGKAGPWKPHTRPHTARDMAGGNPSQDREPGFPGCAHGHTQVDGADRFLCGRAAPNMAGHPQEGR